jgi:peptidoglycan biosynthesis protein MviN/MurJ (putative lipid II flippase)
LRWLFCALPVFSLSLVLQDSLFALHRNTTVMVVNYLAMALHLALAIVLISQQGGTGAAIACLGGETAGLVAFVIVLLRDAGRAASSTRAARQCLAPIAAGVLMALAPRSARRAGQDRRGPGRITAASLLLRALSRAGSQRCSMSCAGSRSTGL